MIGLMLTVYLFLSLFHSVKMPTDMSQMSLRQVSRIIWLFPQLEPTNDHKLPLWNLFDPHKQPPPRKNPVPPQYQVNLPFGWIYQKNKTKQNFNFGKKGYLFDCVLMWGILYILIPTCVICRDCWSSAFFLRSLKLKGSRMDHSVKVSLWCVTLLINTRFRFFFFFFFFLNFRISNC